MTESLPPRRWAWLAHGAFTPWTLCSGVRVSAPDAPPAPDGQLGQEEDARLWGARPSPRLRARAARERPNHL